MLTDQTEKFIIRDGDILTHSDQVVMKASPTVIEKSLDELSEDDQSLYTVAYEVFLIRVYHYDGEWHISTNRRLDAFESHWATGLSFGQYFSLLISRASKGTLTTEEFLCTLDPTVQYYFLVPTEGDNRIGAISTKEPDQFWLAETVNADMNTLPRNIWSFLPTTTHTRLRDFPNAIGVTRLNDDGAIVKYLYKDYLYRKELRNNEPDVYVRYIQLMKAGDLSGQQTFNRQHMYIKEFVAEFNKMIREIHRMYCQRYLRKEYVQLPLKIHQVLKRCLQDYKTHRGKTTPETIRNIVLYNDPKFIMDLLITFTQELMNE